MTCPPRCGKRYWMGSPHASGSASPAERCSPSACRSPALTKPYFEVYPLDELDQTYRVLSILLTAAGVATPLAALILGWWVTRPAFRPLDQVASAAAAMAQGDRGIRIDPRGDPDPTTIAASFNQTAAALENRVRADARFAADVAHELRTPLTTMLSAVALIDRDANRLSDTGQEALSLLRAEVDRFQRLVLDLLEISRDVGGPRHLVPVYPAPRVRPRTRTVARARRPLDRTLRHR